MRRSAHPALVAGLLLAVTSIAAADDRIFPPFDLYETTPLSDESLAGLTLGGWKVLHQERAQSKTWVLLALPDGKVAQDVAGARPRYLGHVRAGERAVLVAPPERGVERLRTGRPVTISPSGAGVSITNEGTGLLARRAHAAYRTLDRALPSPKPRSGAPKGAFADAIARASEGGPRSGLRTPAGVDSAVAKVKADSLERYVRHLSQKASGLPDSRWWDPGSSGDASSILAKADYVKDKLQTALGDSGVAVYEHGFNVLNDDNEIVRVFNIVGRHRSQVTGAGAVLVTAHLDATGVRSDPRALCSAGYKDGTACDCDASSSEILANPACDWDAKRDPAPGADDNATGIAAMIEAARVLGQYSFDFDVYFVAFQAEEIGLVGSAAFADSVVDSGQEVFAVLNMDMLGYNAQANELDVVADESSQWLADWIVQSAQQFVSQLPVEKRVEPFGRSDHASFWARGIDAICLLEDVDLPYPGYHSFRDMWETTFPSAGRPNSEFQFLLSTQLAVASLARLALQYNEPDLALPTGELVATPPSGRDFVVGQQVKLTARVHNFGNSSLTFGPVTTDSLNARVSFYFGDPAQGGTLLGQVTRKTFYGAGAVVSFDWLWDTSAVEPGFHDVFAVVEGLDTGYTQEEISPFNNQASARLFLEAPGSQGARVLSHYAYPNPVRGSRSDLHLYYELTRDAGVEIDIFDLEGLRVGIFRAPNEFRVQGNRAGPNAITASSFRWRGDTLESGVYLYAIRVDGGETSNESRGKFAVVH